MEIKRDRSADENLPEIEQSVAQGEIAALYQDICSTLGVPRVNLIYRYFATIEGGLASVWCLLKPHFKSGAFADLVERNGSLFEADDEHYHLLSSIGPDIETRDDISSILDFYLTANPMNLFALEFLAGTADQATGKNNLDPTLVSIADLRDQADVASFSDPIEELMFLVSQGARSIRPTLLRELQQWPEFVNAVFPYIKTRCLDHRFDKHVKRIRCEVKTQTAALVKPKRLALAPQTNQQITEFCGYFPTILIRMTLIAAGLRRAIRELAP